MNYRSNPYRSVIYGLVTLGITTVGLAQPVATQPAKPPLSISAGAVKPNESEQPKEVRSDFGLRDEDPKGTIPKPWPKHVHEAEEKLRQLAFDDEIVEVKMRVFIDYKQKPPVRRRTIVSTEFLDPHTYIVRQWSVDKDWEWKREHRMVRRYEEHDGKRRKVIDIYNLDGDLVDSVLQP